MRLVAGTYLASRRPLSRVLQKLSSRTVFGILLATTLQLGCAGCGYVYVVRTDGGNLVRKIHLDCAQAAVQLRGRGRHSFVLMQSFSRADNLHMHVGGLHILFNGKEVDYTARTGLKGGAVINGTQLLRGEQDLRVEFYIREGVFENDTILIDMNGYLGCTEHDSVALKPLIFHFNRPVIQDMQE